MTAGAAASTVDSTKPAGIPIPCLPISALTRDSCQYIQKLRQGHLFRNATESWSDWRSALVIVKPETVIGRHRQGFRLFWSWKVRRGQLGRPPVPKYLRELIRRMSRENPLWGAPRIHGELLKLGID